MLLERTTSLSLVALMTCTLALQACSGAANSRFVENQIHHTEEGFRNPHIPLKYSPSREDYVDWLADYAKNKLEGHTYTPTPSVEPDYDAINHPDPDTIQVTWVGHATFLIQVDGYNIITDPAFSYRASPVRFAGPKRLTPPGIPLDKLPPIDLVLVSHNHYDHLDAQSVDALGNHPTYMVPLGMTDWFNDRGITNVVELDWWQQASYGTLRVDGVPAQHFSGRGLFDYNKSLWSGYVVETSQGNLYFAGDTGYSPDFKTIGNLYGPMRISFLPIGAYLPRWKNFFVHINPQEALLVHNDVKSELSIGMHWGTFANLSSEPMDEPKIALEQYMEDEGISKDVFTTFKIGETRIYKKK